MLFNAADKINMLELRANFKSIGLFLLITRFAVHQIHFDASKRLFSEKVVKNLIFERSPPSPDFPDF